MYCVNCGRDIADGIAFCPSCGAKLNESGNAVTASSGMGAMRVTMINQATIGAIYHLLEPLRRLAEENDKLDRSQKFLAKYERKANNPISIIVGVVVGFLYLSFSSTVAGIFGGIVGGAIGYAIFTQRKRNIENNKLNLNTALENINEICAEIDENEIALLPPSYRFYNAAAFFYNAFINQRALTMQQAVNLYEDEMRKDQMALIQQRQMQALGSIQRSSAVSATMNTLNFVSKLF